MRPDQHIPEISVERLETTNELRAFVGLLGSTALYLARKPFNTIKEMTDQLSCALGDRSNREL